MSVQGEHLLSLAEEIIVAFLCCSTIILVGLLAGRTSWTAIPTASHVLDLPFILLNLSGRFFCIYKQGPNFHIHSSEPL